MKPTLALIGILATVCSAQQPLIQAGGPDEVSYSQVEEGSNSPITKSGVYVIRSKDEFHDYLKKLDELDLKQPKIDWAKNQLLAVHLQGTTRRGISLDVKRLHVTKPGQVDIELQVDKSEDHSGGAIRTNIVSETQYPYLILETPKMDAKWTVAIVSG